jgi:ABC-2 type transport system ATP-binding protein
MLGVLNAGNNTIFYDGLNFNKHRLDIIKQIGAIVETPSLYEHLTCMEQLVYLNHFYKQPLKRVDEILEIVGISDSQNTKIKHCSTGMKQRLAIGIALFHHPTMLILDEPFNGLDPEGIFDLRNLLQTEHQKGTTIFISGHIISELEKICTHIAILNDCKLAYCKDSVEPKLEQVYMNVILQKKNDHENR